MRLTTTIGTGSVLLALVGDRGITEYALSPGSTTAVTLTMYVCVPGCALAGTFSHRRLHPAMASGATAILASTQLTHLAQTSL